MSETDRLLVLVQAWPRYPARVEYLQRTLAAFRHHVDLLDWPGPIQYLVSAEADQPCPGGVDAVTACAAEYAFNLRWHHPPPSVGRHLNDALHAAEPWDWLLYLQEDHEAVRDVPVMEARQLLELGEGATGADVPALARFTIARPPSPCYPLTPSWMYVLPSSTEYLFAHNPYLARRRFLDWIGPFAEERSEDRANAKLKAAPLSRVIVHRPNLFTHIGEVPAMTEKHARRKRRTTR